MDKITAPFTLPQVEALTYYQISGVMHPFTCGNRDDGKHVPREGRDLGQLVPLTTGWMCLDCDYTQGWAHAFMADLPLLKEMVAERDGLTRSAGLPPRDDAD